MEEKIKAKINEIMNPHDMKAFHIELEELPRLINEDEELEALASSWIAGKNWLFCVTNKRAFLYCQIVTCELIEIPKESLEHIALKDGVTQADLIIKHNDEFLTITLDCKPAKHMYYLLNCLLHNKTIDRNYHVSSISKYLKIAIAILLLSVILSCLDGGAEFAENTKTEEIAENE